MTPIDLLLERLAENGILHSSDVAEANELFKQQIIDAFNAGDLDSDTYFIPFLKENDESENYYNETFKNTKE
jgi:hypothetical protein